jgi:predicted acylesterase/phospholipase RssA
VAKRRSLILAGGGMKVAYQAGAMQVWLDEAGLEFDHVDGSSGGVFNLAMLCQGMSGSEIADNWRELRALDAVGVNWRALRHPLTPPSMGTLEGMRRKVFPRWGIDIDAIRATSLEATFNTYNFTRHELAVIEPAELTEDLLLSAVSLPMWFPPVVIDGETYIDAVYISDANVEEAIARGADELWVIWTVSERSLWQGGFLGNYFGIIETAANGHFRRIIRRVEESNAAIARGEEGEFGRHIEVRIQRGEVPLNYLLNLSSDRFAAAVERGVREARAWCEEQGIPYTPRAPRAPSGEPSGVRFDEVMRGRVGDSEMVMRLSIAAESIDRFVADPAHEATVAGVVEWPGGGGTLAIEGGAFNLFVDEGDPTVKRMLYRLLVRGADGRALTISGHKRIDRSSGRGLWHETTTLFTRVLDGHVDADGEGDAAEVANGVVHVLPRDFARQLASFRASGPTPGARAAALRRFGVLFMGGLWDVYGRRLLPTSPV